MKIIDAVWEKRNLGVDCHEVIFEREDSLSDLAKLDSLQSNYQVIKIPLDRSDLIFEVQKNNFTFVETLFSSTHDLTLPTLSPPLNRLCNVIDCREVDKFALNNIQKKILSGIFKTDRIALDPHFGIEKSAQRYLGWLSDEVNFGSLVYELTYNNRPVGFFVMKHEEGVFFARIGGVYSYPNVLGLGVVLNHCEIVIAKNLGGHVLHGAFSSNNPSVFNINNILGYKSKAEFNVFVRHISR